MTTPKSSKKPGNTVSHTIDDTDPMSSLRIKLKTADPEIQNYVTALEAENLKCAKKVAKLQAENLTLNSRINILTEENKRKGPSIIIQKFTPDKTRDSDKK